MFSENQLKQFVAEFVGTFFIAWVLMILLSQRHIAIHTIAVGSIVLAMVYSTRHMSGGHFNPATTLAVWLGKKFHVSLVPWYVFVQLLGVLFAIGIGTIYINFDQNKLTQVEIEPVKGIISELLGTFLISYTLLQVSYHHSLKGHSFYGLAVGMSFFVSLILFSNYTVGVFNPAIALGFSFCGLIDFNKLWILWIGEISGAIIAGFLFRKMQ